MDHNGLVDGRECGECTACCRVLAIVDDALDKPAGVLCAHCAIGRGCAIYEARPGLCRTFSCGWLKLGELGDSWRPDRSGVLITLEAPVGQEAGNSGVNLIVTGGDDVATSDNFAGLAASLVDGGSKTLFALPSTPGRPGYNITLNPLLAAGIAARDMAQIRQAIAASYALLKAQP